MNKKPINWFCLSGIVGLVFYALHDIIGGMYYPGYDRLSQAMSDLTATDAPSRAVASGLSSVYGLFSCLCVVLACLLIQGHGNRIMRVGIYLFAIMNWVSGIGYSLFPLSSSGYAGAVQDIMHVVVTVLVVLLSIVSLVLIIIGSFKAKGQYKALAVIASIALACMFVGSVGVNAAPPSLFGLVERFSTYSAVVFTAVLGVYGFTVWIAVPAKDAP